jgi:hypothetical protein
MDELNDDGTQVVDAPNLSIDLDGVMAHKGEDGLNFFDDQHIESLKVWGSDDPTKAKFRDADGKIDGPKVIKAYLDLQRKQGKLSKPLADDASERDRSEHRQAVTKLLNVPATPDEYVALLDKVPEGVKLEDDFVNKLKIADHKHNVSPEGFQSHIDLAAEWIASQKTTAEKMLTDQNTESETKLKASLGPEQYAGQKELFSRVVRDATGDDEAATAFTEALNATLFAGGTETKNILMTILYNAAQQLKGESVSIYSESAARMKEKSEAEEHFPVSARDM